LRNKYPKRQGCGFIFIWKDIFTSHTNAARSINHPHLIATDGCLADTDTFTVAPDANDKPWKSCFVVKCLKILRAEGKITDTVIINRLV
jgi:hypothetical protein